LSLPKLVRDKIPEIIKESGHEPQMHRAMPKEFSNLLIEKMKEELAEFEENPCLDEAADIYEVFLAILDNWGMSRDLLEMVAKSKRDIRGAFKKGIVLEKVL